MSAPQDLLEGQVIIGSDNSLQWYTDSRWYTQPGSIAFGNPPQDSVEAQLAMGNEFGFFWYSNGRWRGKAGVPCTGENPPQDSVEGQIAIGRDGIFCWYTNGIWYTFASNPVVPKTPIGDKSARIFITGEASSGYQFLPGYDAEWIFDSSIFQYSVTFTSTPGINYVIEGRDNPGGGEFGLGTGTIMTLHTSSVIVADFDYLDTNSGAGWLFNFNYPDFPPNTWSYYATDVLDFNTGLPLSFDATWDYDGDRTISVTFTSDDDGTHLWYLGIGTSYGGPAILIPGVGYVSDGPFVKGTIHTISLTLPYTPTEVSFNATLGTIPSILI